MDSTTNIVNQVNKYYIDTAWDYKYLWTSKALAVHFGYYDETVKSHNAALLRMNEILAEKAGIKSGDRIIDAGCGIGGSSIWLAQNKKCEVAGVNIVDQQLGEAALYAKKAGVDDRVSFIKTDYAKLPFGNRTFNVFWALESIVHALSKENVIREAYRVLDMGGRIVIAEYMLRENPALDQYERDFLMPWLHGWSMPSLLTSSVYENYMRSAGFAHIDKIDISKNVRPSLISLKWLCRLALPGAMMMEWLELFTKQRVANIKGSLRQIEAFERGYWKYFIIVGTKTI